VAKRICGSHHYRFYKAEVKKGIIPMLLEHLLDARANTRKEIGRIGKKLKEEDETLSKAEKKQLKLLMGVLDKRQLGYKVSANSMYGGFGSDFSYPPFYPAAASTTAMGRKSIQDAIDFANEYRPDTVLVYGDTDSCMLKFSNVRKLKECFEICEEMEKAINAIFPKPMYLELEKIYSKYFLLSKKRYVGYIVDPNGKLLTTDKKGVVIKRRDNCGYLREIYSHLIDMVMDKEPRWKMYEYLRVKIDNLLAGNVDLEKLVITKSIKDNYKTQNLPHVAVAQKMRDRGKYVASGTRIRYIFTVTEDKKDPQYIKAEDPDYYLKNKETVEIDYLYYFEKQLVNPIDEVLEVKFGVKDVLKNLLRLIKKGVIKNASQYFLPKFKVEN
jgi:DNA polymerase elongation subunit (family B)